MLKLQSVRVSAAEMETPTITTASIARRTFLILNHPASPYCQHLAIARGDSQEIDEMAREERVR